MAIWRWLLWRLSRVDGVYGRAQCPTCDADIEFELRGGSDEPTRRWCDCAIPDARRPMLIKEAIDDADALWIW